MYEIQEFLLNANYKLPCNNVYVYVTGKLLVA